VLQTLLLLLSVGAATLDATACAPLWLVAEYDERVDEEATRHS
jgi:hypothetical protein